MKYKSNHHASAWRLPAEWDPQWGVQLTWPHAKTDWAPILEEITATYQEMAREISKREQLLTVGPEGCMIQLDSDDTWARDHGFISLVDDQGHCRLLDFCFNGWGENNALNRQLYTLGVIKGDYVDCLDFVLEGGSIESDGRGTVFTTTGCLLAPHRNQPLTKAEIEARLKQELCAERILWIDHGNLTGDDTDGHIDTLVRICPDDTLLYVGCDDPADEQYAELKLMEEQLKTFRTLEGKPYRLLKLPEPSMMERTVCLLPMPISSSSTVQCFVPPMPSLSSIQQRSVSSARPSRIVRLSPSIAVALSNNMAACIAAPCNFQKYENRILTTSQ